MTPFRLSFTARLLSAGATVLLAGAGLAVIAGAGHVVIPLMLLLGIGCGIVALVVGAQDHPREVLLAAILLPMALWPYAIGLEWVATVGKEWAWLLVVAGALPAIATFVAPYVRRPAAAPQPQVQRG